MYSIAFILVRTAAANALLFASHVLAAAGYSDPVQYAVRGNAIGAVAIVCLLHGIWRKLGIAVTMCLR